MAQEGPAGSHVHDEIGSGTGAGSLTAQVGTKGWTIVSDGNPMVARSDAAAGDGQQIEPVSYTHLTLPTTPYV